ncbi:hypothetical protein D3C72_1862900 [compost metagenome]
MRILIGAILMVQFKAAAVQQSKQLDVLVNKTIAEEYPNERILKMTDLGEDTNEFFPRNIKARKLISRDSE